MKPKLCIVTSNTMKFKELSHVLEEFFICEQKFWDEPEIQGSPEEIIKHKLNLAYEKFQQPVLVEDTSVYLEALNGFPGPYMKDFWKCFTPEEMGKKFAGSRIKVTCDIGLQRSHENIIIAQGSAVGVVIAPTHNEHHERGFDLFMQVDGTDKPMIKFSHEEKNKFSHRGSAIKNLLDILKKENK